ncbi:AraC family transcriptional regulator [Crocinitomix catalasitica]|nr:AraC family transcriptional regulator [Crocinitomix catalasitica]
MISFRKYYPHPQLKEHIQSYFIIEADPSMNSEQEQENDFLNNHPQGTIDLMFALKDGINLANFKGDRFSLSNIFVMAQQEGFFQVKFGENVLIAGVVFYAESFAKLFNFPMADLTNQGCSLQDELSETYLDLYDKLSLLSAEEQIIEELNLFFTRELSNVDYSFSKFDQLVRWMRTSENQTTVTEMADLANMSKKTLQRQMKKLTGLTPKSYGNILRFNAVLKLIDDDKKKLDWQDILFQSGYYDQAHFIKDFRRFTGLTPNQFLKENETLSKLFLKD